MGRCISRGFKTNQFIGVIRRLIPFAVFIIKSLSLRASDKWRSSIRSQSFCMIELRRWFHFEADSIKPKTVPSTVQTVPSDVNRSSTFIDLRMTLLRVRFRKAKHYSEMESITSTIIEFERQFTNVSQPTALNFTQLNNFMMNFFLILEITCRD